MKGVRPDLKLNETIYYMLDLIKKKMPCIALCTRHTLITTLVVLTLAIGLFLLMEQDGLKTTVAIGWKHVLNVSNGVRISKVECSSETRKALINSPLPIKVNESVNVEELEKSGCFEINASREGIWRLAVDKNFEDITCGSTEKHFLTVPKNETRIALKSEPGSGNTWVRYLLEETTGINTGSIYGNPFLAKRFKGENTIHNVIAIKTHGLVPRTQYDKVILIVRDIFDATLAEYNRKGTKYNQTGITTIDNFNAMGFKRKLEKQVSSSFCTSVIDSFSGDIFVLFYDKLQSDMLNSLTKLAAFCKAEVTLKRLWCTYKNSEGYVHRGKKPGYMSRRVLVDKEMEGRISKWKENIHVAIKKRKYSCATN